MGTRVWWRAAIAIGVASAIVLAIGACLPHVAEDAYISFRCAANLVDHGELVFNIGERVEAYTNFAWTLMMAVAYLLAIPIELAARWLGFAFAVASIVYVYRYAALFDANRAPLAPIVLGSMVYHSIWTWLGLEPSAFGFFVLAAFYYVDNRSKEPSYGLASVCAALAYLTRPEGGLVILAVTALAISRRTPARWTLAGFLVAVLAAHVAFRVGYYGDLFPNTFHAKAHVSWESIAYGARYVSDLTIFGGGAVALALALACRRRLAGTDTDRVAVATVLVFLVYLVLVGGDYMGASRFGAPMLPVVCVWMFRAAISCWERNTVSRGAVVVAIAAHLGLSTFALHRELSTTRDADISRVGFLQRYVHDRLLVGEWLEANVDGPRTITGSAMGVLPWHLRRARVIDARGITDRNVATMAPIVSARPGHARFATDTVLLSHHPEVLLHRYGIGASPTPRHAPAGYHSVCVAIESMEDGEWFCFAKRNDVPLTIGRPPPGMSLAIVDRSGTATWR